MCVYIYTHLYTYTYIHITYIKLYSIKNPVTHVDELLQTLQKYNVFPYKERSDRTDILLSVQFAVEKTAQKAIAK